MRRVTIFGADRWPTRWPFHSTASEAPVGGVTPLPAAKIAERKPTLQVMHKALRGSKNPIKKTQKVKRHACLSCAQLSEFYPTSLR